METQSYDADTINCVAPLLLSISRELIERGFAVRALDLRLKGTLSQNERHALVAERANHRREIRLAERELDNLGCSVAGRSPFTLRIPVESKDRPLSVLWTLDDLEHTRRVLARSGDMLAPVPHVAPH